MVIKGLLKYRLFLLACVSTVAFLVYYFSVFSANYENRIQPFQKKFSQLENNLDKYLGYKKQEIKKNGVIGDWKSLDVNAPFNMHIYRNDSLLFWNTNHLPIIRFAEIHFPAGGILHLQNGWYYAKIFEEEDYTICVSFLIKRDYSYENKDLVNEFVAPLKVSFDATISLEQEPKYAIYSKNKEFLFSLMPHDYQLVGEGESQILLLLLLSSLIFFLFALLIYTERISTPYKWVIPFLVIGFRVLSIQYVWFGFLHDTQAFQASLYGANDWFPNFFEYLLNCIIILYIIFFLKNRLNDENNIIKKKVFAYLFFLLNIPFWILVLYLNKGLIENSSIPLIIDHLFSLNVYSILAIVSIGILYYAYFIYTRAVIRLSKKINVGGSQLAMLSFFTGIVYFIYEINVGQQLFFASIFPMLFISIMVYHIYREGKSYHLGFGITFLLIFSVASALNLAEFNRRKEKGERELYANQLAAEQDIVTEVEYSLITDKIKTDDFLLKFIATPNISTLRQAQGAELREPSSGSPSSMQRIGLSDFEDGLERRIFNGFWERYEMSFNLFDTLGNSFIAGGENKKNAFNELNEIVNHHSQTSEIDSNIFFIYDYTGQYSYIIRQQIIQDGYPPAILFATLKSKKIPEEIGFPRLLISSKAQVFESLENYSIAKYHNGRLVTKYGSFNFPSTVQPITTWKKEAEGYYNNDGYSHYIMNKSKYDVIVLSSKNYTWIELITSFSYLFSFYGILLLPMLFRLNSSPLFKRTLTLAVKIQLVLIGLVFVSLLAFGWGSGVFVRNQYNEYTNDVISEKLASVDLELRSKLGHANKLSIQEDGNYIEFLLQKFSKVFVTDINLYDGEGFILATSRPKVFNMGLLSEQMNPTAVHAFLVKNKSEFVHDEKIGKLKYASAYLPFYNNEGDMLGFVNLQHFGQQKEFEDQIQKFLVAIINVFMLLLAISIVFAIFISNWVTAPLRILQENFSKIRFGKHNQQILYDKDDEIGALVKDYNQKLEELEYTAQQLAQSERESAWREMAKQVAHEIKNPLTPMKLSIQQLLRVFDPKDPDSEKKIQKVAKSIIEQIDALTKIANEFSNFAKMPKPDEVTLDLLPILENVIEVFREETICEIQLKTKLSSAIIKGDKDQMIRTFNNLLKNAMQSIPPDIKGIIVLSVEQLNNMLRISVQDNGIGIPEEKKSKIFVPYFTTKTTGTGLGLAMVKQIIENHNGIIYFETEEGKGTTFVIELPIP